MSELLQNLDQMANQASPFLVFMVVFFGFFNVVVLIDYARKFFSKR